MSPLEISVDTETLGLKHDAAIFAIGAYVSETGQSFHGSVNPAELLSSLKAEEVDTGEDYYKEPVFTYDEATIKWHEEKNKVNWFNYQSCSNYFDTLSLLVDFKTWIEQIKDENPNRPIEIWVRGPDFDITKLKYHFDQWSLELPWSYKQVRDVRTLDALIDTDLSKPTGAHDAFIDAKFQAMLVDNCLRKLAEMKEAYDRVSKISEANSSGSE